MHVFIDTNILLNFFHFTKDELDALNDVFASHEHGAAKVHLTQPDYCRLKTAGAQRRRGRGAQRFVVRQEIKGSGRR